MEEKNTIVMNKLTMICNSFNDNLELLEEYVVSIDEGNFGDKCDSMWKDIIMENFDLEADDSGSELIKFKGEDIEDLKKILRIYSKQRKNGMKRKILFRSALMSLVVYFEGMISDIFKYLINKNPESITNNKQLTFKEIKELGSMENAIEYLVEKEIEVITRGDYNDWCTKLRDKFKFTLNNIKEEESIVIEIIKRRNLYVHNNGYVNNIYLKTVDKELRKGVKKDDILEVDIDYIKNAIKILKKVGNDILMEFLIKNDKKSEFYWNHYFREGYKELQNGNYFNSIKIFEVLSKDKNRKSEDILQSKANLFLAKKLIGEYNDIEEEINEMDISALSDDFKIVFLLIKGEKDSALELLERAYPIYVTKEEILAWPAFKEILNDKRLKRIINEGLEYEIKRPVGYTIKNKIIKELVDFIA